MSKSVLLSYIIIADIHCVFPAGFGSNFRIMIQSVSGPGSTFRAFLGSIRVRAPLLNKIRVRVGSVLHIYGSLWVREPWRIFGALKTSTLEYLGPASRGRCSPQDPGGVVGSTSRGVGVEKGRFRGIDGGWRWVGLGICKVEGVGSGSNHAPWILWAAASKTRCSSGTASVDGIVHWV